MFYLDDVLDDVDFLDVFDFFATFFVVLLEEPQFFDALFEQFFVAQLVLFSAVFFFLPNIFLHLPCLRMGF